MTSLSVFSQMSGYQTLVENYPEKTKRPMRKSMKNCAQNRCQMSGNILSRLLWRIESSGSGCHVLNLCVILTGWIFCHKTTIIPCLFANIFQNKQGAIVGFCNWTFEWVNTNSEWMNIVIHKVHIRYHPLRKPTNIWIIIKTSSIIGLIEKGG